MGTKKLRDFQRLWMNTTCIVRVRSITAHNTFIFMVYFCTGVAIGTKCSFKWHYTCSFLQLLLLNYWWIALTWLSLWSFPTPLSLFTPFSPRQQFECFSFIQSSVGLFTGEVVWKCTTEVPYSLRMKRLILYLTQLRFIAKRHFPPHWTLRRVLKESNLLSKVFWNVSN